MSDLGHLGDLVLEGGREEPSHIAHILYYIYYYKNALDEYQG